MTGKDSEGPVFFDPRGQRQRHVRGTTWFFAGLTTVLAVVGVASVLIHPLLPDLGLRHLPGMPHAADVHPLPAPPAPPTAAAQRARRAQLELAKVRKKIQAPAARAQPAQPTTPPTPHPLAIGFYVNWDDSSYESLHRHLASLDEVVPEWLRLQDGPQPLVPEIEPRALTLIRRDKPQVPILPMLHNSKQGKWDPMALVHAVKDASHRAALVEALVAFTRQNGFAGVVLDFEEVPEASQANLLAFVNELHAAFAAHGWLVEQALPFDDEEYDYAAYGAALDRVLLMAYDEHWSASEAGSVAGQPWFERILTQRLRQIPPQKTIVCIGGYGYDWEQDEEAVDVTFQEAILTARDSQAPVIFDPASRNPHFDYADDAGNPHSVWFLDAVTAQNEMRAAASQGVLGFALWRLGSEDPSLWTFFGAPLASWNAQALKAITFGYGVDFEGTGEILEVVAQPQEGARELSQDATSITDERFAAMPSSYVIRRTGDDPGKVALTFDDGPDKQWTPQILDVLKREGVPATFFVIGENALAEPDLVRRIVAEGHDIGNHTFTHPNLAEVPGLLADVELNAAQRLIESLTGRSMRLFRAPYFGDAEPTIPAEVEPIVRARKLGYLAVGLRVDGQDWARPGVDAIVRNVVEGIEDDDPETRGQVVLLHDSGGDRAQTVAALPQIIHQLKAKHFQFVTVAQLGHMTHDEAMPPVPPGSFVDKADAVSVYALSLGSFGLHWLFLAGIVLGVLRLVFVGTLALVQWRRSRRTGAELDKEEPFLVSVLVPAFNEEAVIAKTIESLLASDYQRLEILVIDDGSPDRTSEVVRERFADNPRVRLFRKENGGKAMALNYGMRQAQGEVVVGMDADTVFAPNTVGLLARALRHPKIGAVAGNAKVGNRINLVTSWQALEYITAQNLDRRAFALLGCITVVPGAVGAWRRDVVEKLGGFSHDTLAEDQDLTLEVLRAGYKVAYEEDAIARTEAPDTLGGLAKQRFRWSFGTLQCMWKHKDALLRPKYGALGWIAMPNVWLFQVFFPLISPVMDLLLVWSLITAALERYEHPGEQGFANLGQVLFFYALFLALDWLAAAFAFALERREQWSLLIWLFLQRFCYRQVMYWVMVKSVSAALHGKLHGWGKLERKGTVGAQP